MRKGLSPFPTVTGLFWEFIFSHNLPLRIEKVENGYIYTIEGNASDTCKELAYPLGYFEILGFGVPEY